MLLDTSGLLCLLHRDEPQHEAACQCYQTARSRWTHAYVLAEFVALGQARRLPRPAVLEFLNDLTANPEVEVVWVDRQLHELAMQLLAERLDKKYSLCDAVSFILMRDRGLQDALTTDHHFEQEGFRKLLD
ncbi:MAG: type II toxin-antitoxin system VapC family toxin [Planctomycetia bacterium]|nr:type II toxin-antitoxin system VapC family toxin [Planctomycetia bacterium]